MVLRDDQYKMVLQEFLSQGDYAKYARQCFTAICDHLRLAYIENSLVMGGDDLDSLLEDSTVIRALGLYNLAICGKLLRDGDMQHAGL